MPKSGADKIVKDEFRKAVDTIPGLAPRSRTTYASVLRHLADFPEFPGLQAFLRWPANDIMDRLAESYDNMNSMRTAALALGKLLAPLQRELGWSADEIEDWKQLQREKDEVYYQPCPVTWRQLQEAERALRDVAPGSRDHIALALYVLFPPRNAYDYSVMKFATLEDDAEENLCIVPDGRAAHGAHAPPCTFVFGRFKNKQAFGEQRFELRESPQGFDFKALSNALRVYHAETRYVHPTDTHSIYRVTRDLFGESFGPSMIRRALLDDIRENIDDYEIEDLDFIGQCMSLDISKKLLED